MINVTMTLRMTACYSFWKTRYDDIGVKTADRGRYAKRSW